MRNNRFLVFLAIALFLINIVLVYFLWNSKQRQTKRDKGDRVDWMVSELNLDEKQKAEHKKLKDAHFNSIKPIFDSITATRKQLYELIKDPAANDSLIDAYTRRIGEQHTQITQQTFQHFKSLRAICTPEQQLKLDTVIQKIVQNMGKRGDRKGKKENDK